MSIFSFIHSNRAFENGGLCLGIRNPEAKPRFSSSFQKLSLGLILAIFFLLPTITHAAAFTNAPSNLGLMGYWSMNEGVGSIVGDSSGNGYNGSFINSPTWTNGKLGKALSFNSAAFDAVSLPLQTSVKGKSQVSVSMWFKVNDTSNLYDLYTETIAADQTTRFTLRLSTGTLLFAGRDQDGGGGLVTWVTGPSINANQWYHVVAIFDSVSDVHTIYVNGVLAGSNSFPVAPIINSAPFTNPVIGTNPTNSGESFPGILDEVRLYGRALSASEIAALYKSSVSTHKAVSNQGLIGYWPLNEGTSTIAGDFSGYGNNGTLTNFSNPFTATSGWTNGKFGKGLNFELTNDFVDINPIIGDVSVTQGSISVWVKTNSTASGYRQIIDLRTDGSNEIQIYDAFGQDGNNLQIGYYAGGVQKQITNSSLALGQWYHLVVTWSVGSDQVKGYLNGVQISTTQTGLGTWSGALVGAVIGNNTNANGAWTGSIDEVRIYNRVLSAAEIASLYKTKERSINTSQNTKISNGLVGLWSFNGQDMNWASGIAYDRSGQGNNGTLSGMTQSGSIAVGKVGQALNFTGQANVGVNLGTGSSITGLTGNFTMSEWIYPRSYGGFLKGRLFDSSDGANGIIWYVDNANHVQGLSMNNGDNVISCFSTDNIITLNTWQYVVVTVSGGVITFYVNGVDGGSCGPFSPFTASTGSAYIGYSTATATREFDGYIDEARVYNRVLSASEIIQLYRAGR